MVRIPSLRLTWETNKAIMIMFVYYRVYSGKKKTLCHAQESSSTPEIAEAKGYLWNGVVNKCHWWCTPSDFLFIHRFSLCCEQYVSLSSSHVVIFIPSNTLGSALLCEEAAQNMLLLSSIDSLLYVQKDKHGRDIFTPKVLGDKNEKWKCGPGHEWLR